MGVALGDKRRIEPAQYHHYFWSIVDVRIELERMREGIPRICSTDKERADYKSIEAATVRESTD